MIIEDTRPFSFLEDVTIATYLILISPMFILLGIYSLFNSSFRKWYNDTLSDGINDGISMLVLFPIMVVFAFFHPIETYRIFTNKQV